MLDNSTNNETPNKPSLQTEHPAIFTIHAGDVGAMSDRISELVKNHKENPGSKNTKSTFPEEDSK